MAVRLNNAICGVTGIRYPAAGWRLLPREPAPDEGEKPETGKHCQYGSWFRDGAGCNGSKHEWAVTAHILHEVDVRDMAQVKLTKVALVAGGIVAEAGSG